MAGIAETMHRTGARFALALAVCMTLKKVEQSGGVRVKERCRPLVI
jgi:hypothetical protein